MGLPYVSVCSGIGLLDLAVSRVFREAFPVALVEREAFCIAHLADKMEEGALAPAPICTDLRDLQGSSLPNVELLFGGIPCQPHSHAGKGKRKDDDRDLVDEFLRVTGELEPSVVIVENVAGFVHPGGLGRLLGPLADLGFHAEWGTLRASDVGAPHRRRRVFVVAYRNQRGLEVLRSSRVLDRERDALGDVTDGCLEAVGDTEGDLGGTRVSREKATVGPDEERRGGPTGSGEAVGDTGCLRLERRRESEHLRGTEGRSESQGDQRERHGDTSGNAVQAVGDTDSSRLEGREVCGSQCARECAPWPPGPEGDWSGVPQRLWPTEPYVRGVVDGSAYRVDRLRALGNGVVPQQAEQAIRALIRRALRDTT